MDDKKKIHQDFQSKLSLSGRLKGRIETFINIPITRNWYVLSDSEKRRYYEEKKYVEPNENLV